MKLDLDYFKQVNDSLGHGAGDQILINVAGILTQQTRAEDFVGRIGGDEFVIFIDNPPSLHFIEEIANRIVQAVGRPMTIDRSRCRVGASTGFTIAATSMATPDQMLIKADLALYEAKRAGRRQAWAHSDALAAEIETRRMLFDEITTALEEDQFEPDLQPQVSTETGALFGCEVLAGWRHPDRGIGPPATFIAAAEEAGLVDRIDRIMTEKALEELRAEGVDVPVISVNASAATLRDPHLAGRLVQEIRARHLVPSNLTIEVLECTLIKDDDDIILHTIEALSAAGFSIVLDNFGTEYASMSNFSRLHLNAIELDKSLIKPVPDTRADSIISALVALSRNLDMRVVAEGIETPGHLETGRRLKCGVLQGYEIGRPMPRAAFADWYRGYTATPQPWIKPG